ncbi:MAG: pyridoxine 4-dehydrogenase [Solirubrobacteraceae bacterium]|nr:pyridoxine 4-dehydrogenase [Solirubrobacteraceae bacterium]
MTQPARAGGEFAIGGDLLVRRLGYGTMQIPGPGVWGEPRDRDEVIRVLRRAVELGVTLIDTADSYGPEVSERVIRDALCPYPDDLVIATKAGFMRPGPGRWERNGKPAYLKAQAEKSLRLLGLERIELFQLHRIDPAYELADQLGALLELRAEGKIGRIGLSEVSVSEIQEARAIAPIATVQNRYNLAERGAESIVDYCEREGIGFLPWFPMATGRLADAGGPLARIADEVSATPAQLALAWLLHRSPVLLPIPGTSTVAHVEENVAAATIELSPDQIKQLDAAI